MRLTINNNNDRLIDLSVEDLNKAWRGAFEANF